MGKNSVSTFEEPLRQSPHVSTRRLAVAFKSLPAWLAGETMTQAVERAIGERLERIRRTPSCAQVSPVANSGTPG